MSQPEMWNLNFPAIVDERGRITVKKEIIDTAKILPGDTIFVVITGISRKGSTQNV